MEKLHEQELKELMEKKNQRDKEVREMEKLHEQELKEESRKQEKRLKEKQELNGLKQLLQTPQSQARPVPAETPVEEPPKKKPKTGRDSCGVAPVMPHRDLGEVKLVLASQKTYITYKAKDLKKWIHLVSVYDKGGMGSENHASIGRLLFHKVSKHSLSKAEAEGLRDIYLQQD